MIAKRAWVGGWLLFAACAVSACLASEVEDVSEDCPDGCTAPLEPSEGVLVVTDTDGDVVLMFDGSGAPLGELVSMTTSPVERPSAVRFDERGSLYVTNFRKGAVLKYNDPDGSFASVLFHNTRYLEEPVDLDVLGDRLFVLGNDSKNIVVIDVPSGEFLREFGRDEVRRPHDFTFGADRSLYIATDWDPNNSGVVQVWDVTEDRMLRRFGTIDEIGDAAALTFGPDGVLYVADYFTGQIARFDADTGAYLGDFVAPGSGVARPVSLSFGSEGALYVAASDGIHRFRDDGVYLGMFVQTGEAGLRRARSIMWRFGQAAARLAQ